MPWFRKRKSLQLKRKKRLSKKDISKPTDFQHCYHAVYDNSIEGFAGLPPQWSSLVSSPKPSVKSVSSSHNSLDSTLVATTSPDKIHAVIKASPTTKPRTEEQISVDVGTPVQITSSVVERNNLQEDLSKVEPKISSCDSAGSSKVSLASSSSLSLTKRPSPIIRGSDNCLEETIQYIRKHYRSSSHGNPIEQEVIRDGVNTRPQSGDKQIAEEEFIDIHFGSRSRAGSLLQLRTSPVNRRQIVSFTSGSTSAMSHSNDRFPSTFYQSAPNEVARSDLGLYDCENGSEYNAMISRINSPSESSGYFGSTRSSLNSSRMSSFQQLSSACSPSGVATSQGTALPPSRPLHPYQREHPEIVCYVYVCMSNTICSTCKTKEIRLVCGLVSKWVA